MKSSSEMRFLTIILGCCSGVMLWNVILVKKVSNELINRQATVSLYIFVERLPSTAKTDMIPIIPMSISVVGHVVISGPEC